MVVYYDPLHERYTASMRRDIRAPSHLLSDEYSALHEPIMSPRPELRSRDAPGGCVAPGVSFHFPLKDERGRLMLRASLIALALGLGTSSAAWSQTSSPQIGAVPPPPWAPVPTPSAAPVTPAPQAPASVPAPIQPMPAPAAASAPTILLVQLAPAVAAAPVAAIPSAQSAGAAYGYVNPFVSSGVGSGQWAAGSGQQGAGQVALLPLTLIADNPWVVDRMLGRLGAWLHARGQPTLRFTLPQTVGPVPTAPAPAAAPVMYAPAQAVTAVPITAKRPSCTAFGRWFWGD